MKKIWILILAIFIGIAAFGSFKAIFWQAEYDNGTLIIGEEESEVPISMFGRDNCGHCQDEKEFLEELYGERQDFNVYYHNLAEPTHREHFNQLTELEGIAKVTPVTLVGNTIIQGFDSAETTGRRIEELIRGSVGQNTLDFEEYVAAGGAFGVESMTGVCADEATECSIEGAESSEFTVKLPFFGVVDLQKYSLPALSVILGFVDGFNPCAMWVLIIFLTLLIQSGSKRKMLQIAGLFIVAETVMYYLILNAWYKTWDFVGLDEFITPIVGLVAVSAGMFFLYEFIKGDGECKVTNPEKRKKIIDRIRALVNSPMTLVTALGIIGIALSVNIIEFACSIGIPQAFTKILDLNMLGTLKQQFYMFLYILFYMLDDVLVFGIAIYSFEKIGIATKYTRVAHLIGGTLMALLGYLLIFNPGALAVF